jgi:putative oxidoreductase
MNDILDIIARFFIAFLFFFEAYDSLAYYQLTLDKMTAYGLTWQQDFLLIGSSILLIVGGIMLLIGYRVRLASFLLLLYWVPLTFIIHSWWNDPAEIQREQSVLFIKNIAIMGALLLLIVNGSGRYSVRRLIDSRKIKT